MTKLPRQINEELERQVLAPYAQLSSMSLGRRYPEERCSLRTDFYRDLGRIVHSTAFRLLEYKTQVFINDEGDYYRTRLTHSLEVGQISVGLAKVLGVNADLAETIALSHDIGHAPFGHTGEGALNALMESEGGFEHNIQSYRIVSQLEERYPDFPGLNLTYEVREGILKHTTVYDKPKDIDDFEDVGFPTIEAQIVNFADEIAFMNHDLDDGLHWGMLSIDSLKEVVLWDEAYREVGERMPQAPERIKRIRTISFLIGSLIDDLQLETRKRIKEYGIETLEDVRQKGKNLVLLSDGMQRRTEEAKNFLYEKVYRHPQVVEMSKRGSLIVNELFQAYLKEPRRLSDKYFKRFQETGAKRHICDYIAGMTDRFAISEHKKLFD